MSRTEFVCVSFSEGHYWWTSCRWGFVSTTNSWPLVLSSFGSLRNREYRKRLGLSQKWGNCQHGGCQWL